VHCGGGARRRVVGPAAAARLVVQARVTIGDAALEGVVAEERGAGSRTRRGAGGYVVPYGERRRAVPWVVGRLAAALVSVERARAAPILH
jgi:hypothetical protein